MINYINVKKIQSFVNKEVGVKVNVVRYFVACALPLLDLLVIQ